ncbi:zinc finger BED domain-containing protein RICESLEEPER 2 [Tanacetum coccineum]
MSMEEDIFVFGLPWWMQLGSFMVLKMSLSPPVANGDANVPRSSEAAFSMGGRILDPYRTRLSTSIVEALICTHDWVRKSRTQINWDDVEGLIKDDEIVNDMEEQLEKLNERDNEKQTVKI